MREVPVAEILDANHLLATLIAIKKGDFAFGCRSIRSLWRAKSPTS